MKTVKIEKYNTKHLKNVLNFLKKNVYTKRTKESWIKNSMTATIAKDKKTIIGILPFEKIAIKIHNKFEKVMWISSLFLLPKYRNKKLGKKILEYSKKIFSKNIKYFFVMREDPESKAFRWYKKNGFKVISRILSLEKKIKFLKLIKIN